VGRWMRLLIFVLLLILPLALALAQDPPPQPPPDDDSAPPGAQPSDPGDEAIIIPAMPGGPEDDPEPVPPIEPLAVPGESEEIDEGEIIEEDLTALLTDGSVEILIPARLDLELLAGMARPQGRPEGWSGSTDIDNPQYALLLRLDLELLAGGIMGANSRPDGWFGVVASTPYAVARDIRHDLELLADRVFESSTDRPAEWAGGEPLLRCDRTTQAVVRFLELNGVFNLQADRTAEPGAFCRQAAVEVSLFMELNYLASPVAGRSLLEPAIAEAGVATTGEVSINSTFAVAFFDRNAARRAGVFPVGAPLQPVARSYVQFSNMMLVRGDGFELFVDYQFTTVTRDEFRALPDIDTIEYQPGCTVEWCAGE
jgi:hypothetical protein